MKNDREFTGTLLGFDDFVSESGSPFALLAYNIYAGRYGPGGRHGIVSDFLTCKGQVDGSNHSEATPQGRKKTKLNQTLLNGNNICMVRIRCGAVFFLT